MLGESSIDTEYIEPIGTRSIETFGSRGGDFDDERREREKEKAAEKIGMWDRALLEI